MWQISFQLWAFVVHEKSFMDCPGVSVRALLSLFDLQGLYGIYRTVTASGKRLYRDIRMEELVPWIWSGTNHHDIISLCLPKDSRSREGGTVSRDALWPDTSL